MKKLGLPGVLTISYKAKWLMAGDCFINRDIGWPIPPAAPRIATFCWCCKRQGKEIHQLSLRLHACAHILPALTYGRVFSISA